MVIKGSAYLFSFKLFCSLVCIEFPDSLLAPSFFWATYSFFKAHHWSTACFSLCPLFPRGSEVSMTSTIVTRQLSWAQKLVAWGLGSGPSPPLCQVSIRQLHRYIPQIPLLATSTTRRACGSSSLSTPLHWLASVYLHPPFSMAQSVSLQGRNCNLFLALLSSGQLLLFFCYDVFWFLSSTFIHLLPTLCLEYCKTFVQRHYS